MSTRLSPSDFRGNLGAILDRVHEQRSRFVIVRKGVPVAAVVPLATLEAMEALSSNFMLATLKRPRRRRCRDSMALANQAKHRSRAK